jgi:hypothetical protein
MLQFNAFITGCGCLFPTPKTAHVPLPLLRWMEPLFGSM